jgi:hypothetical protein
MPRDTLLMPLLEIAQGTALSEADLTRMVGDEIFRSLRSNAYPTR